MTRNLTGLVACFIEIIMDEFRQKIKSLRRKMGWTQEDLARKIDVSLSTVQRWEKRQTRPTRLARRELKILFKAAGLDSI